MGEVLPEAERALATMHQVGADTALHLTSMAVPAALVSLVSLVFCMRWGQGRMWHLGRQCGPGRGRCRGLFLAPWQLMENKIIGLQGLAERLPGTEAELCRLPISVVDYNNNIKAGPLPHPSGVSRGTRRTWDQSQLRGSRRDLGQGLFLPLPQLLVWQVELSHLVMSSGRRGWGVGQ